MVPVRGDDNYLLPADTGGIMEETRGELLRARSILLEGFPYEWALQTLNA